MGSGINVVVRFADGRVKTGTASKAALTEKIQSEDFPKVDEAHLWSIFEDALLEDAPCPIAPDEAGLIVIDAKDGVVHSMMDGRIDHNTAFVVRFALQAKQDDWQERLAVFESLCAQKRIAVSTVDEDGKWSRQPFVSYDELKDIAVGPTPMTHTVRIEYNLGPWNVTHHRRNAIDSIAMRKALVDAGLGGEELEKAAWRTWIAQLPG